MTGTVLLAAAFVTATGYLVYRDDLLGATLARQVRMQHEYEGRIAALRSELDRVTSRHVVETRGVEEQLADLLARQSTIEERHASLGDLFDKARDIGIDVAAAAPLPRPRPMPAAPAPTDAPLAYAPLEAERRDIISDTLIRGSEAQPAFRLRGDLKPAIREVEASIDAVRQEQGAALDALDAAARAEAARLTDTLGQLGIVAEPGAAPQGGPFVAAGIPHFVERTAMLERTLDGIAGLRRTARALPLRMPLQATRLSSRFGYRSDPFLHRPALHSGLDLVAAEGTEVRATAPGRVVSAGWNGGYGNMVEVRHADGLSTRYGHLSSVLVEEGAEVAEGSVVGRVGSTGRSTGAHLHYEVRRSGRAVDPAPYLAAGRRL